MADRYSQWTVERGEAERGYALVLRDLSTVHFTLDVGTPGLTISQLVRDATAAPNVFYGSGVASDGYGWAGWLYPNLRPDDAPPYPFTNASQVISLGTTDAQTSTGSGVSTWQRRMSTIGYRLAADGRYSAEDVAACKAVQTARGLQRDGVVGPQTWAATFDVGSNGGDLSGAVRMPLAYDTRVEPRLFTASGADAGPNPAYDPTVLRVEQDTAYGAGISKADGRRSAVAEYARASTPAWVGTLVLTVDPAAMSRFMVRPGMNVLLRGWAGTDVLLHVSGVSVSGMTSVSLTVDTHGRDLMTVAAILTRDASTAADLARRPGAANRLSRTTADTIVDFDGESGAGQIPRLALFRQLWTVLRIPVSQAGRIARFDFQTSPPTAYSIALFGSPISPADLQSLVGAPLADALDGMSPYQRAQQRLEDEFGFIEAFGSSGQPAGFWPGTASADNPVTGTLRETAAIEYVSQRPPWVWVAIWSAEATFGQGRLLPAPITA